VRRVSDVVRSVLIGDRTKRRVRCCEVSIDRRHNEETLVRCEISIDQRQNEGNLAYVGSLLKLTDQTVVAVVKTLYAC
jgi:hypothetical protein